MLEFNYGKSLPDKLRSGKGFPVYGSNGIIGYHDIALTNGETIIIGRKGSVGEISYSSVSCFPIDTTYYINQFHGMPAKFWFYWLKYANLSNLNKATTIPGLNRNDAYSVSVVLPPLPEQKRITDKLDVLMVRIDSCQTRLERIPQILNRFRRSVLTKAISGDLTEAWREEKGFSRDEWETKTGNEIFPFMTSGSRGWAKYYSNTGAKFIRVGNLNHDTLELDLSDIQCVNLPDSVEGRRTRIEVGDILISITADIGMVGYIDTEIGEAYINQHICLARQNGNYVGKYLAYFLASPIGGLSQFIKAQRGVTKAGLTLKDIGKTIFQIPTLDEQNEIVRRIEHLFSLADKLETRWQMVQDRVMQLTPSLLAKAFHGELVEQNPEDEPASVLLGRIRAEREKAPKRKSKKIRRPIMRSEKAKRDGERIGIFKALQNAGEELPSEELFFAAGYPSDAESELVEEFFVELREALKNYPIKRSRRQNADWFSLKNQ